MCFVCHFVSQVERLLSSFLMRHTDPPFDFQGLFQKGVDAPQDNGCNTEGF